MHYYMPIDAVQPSNGGLFVRTRGPAAEQAEEVRRALQQLMPGASYVTVTPMTTIIAPAMRSWKLGATMFAVFGALALVLAAIGLYSVIAYNVTQRTHEMGVRVALGAQARDVIRLIVREGLRLVMPGVVLGAVVALVAGKWVAPLLFEVSPKDPPVLVARDRDAARRRGRRRVGCRRSARRASIRTKRCGRTDVSRTVVDATPLTIGSHAVELE